ncbi:hypothetical protein ACP70R_048422 [Stipagrostis hirtigluma subsp. patula]
MERLCSSPIAVFSPEEKLEIFAAAGARGPLHGPRMPPHLPEVLDFEQMKSSKSPSLSQNAPLKRIAKTTS